MKQSKKGFITIHYCGTKICEPGYSFGAIRPHYILHIVQSGKGRYYRAGQVYELKTGDAFLLVPLESSTYTADMEDPWKFTWIGFDGPAAESLLSQTCFLNDVVFHGLSSSGKQEEFFSLLEHLFQTYLETGADSYTLLGQFLELLEFMRTTPRYDTENDPERYLQRAREYIHNNYPYPIRVTDIADAAGIDRTYLYRIFMEKEKVSPKQYLSRLRLQISMKLLKSTSYSITEIAYSCGFSDSASFCRQFQAAFQETPGSFRKKEIGMMI